MNIEFGTDEVHEKCRVAWEQIDSIYERMMALPIHTMRGAAVMARATAIAGCVCRLWSTPDTDLEFDDIVVRKLIASLAAAGGVALPVVEIEPKEEEEDA